MADGRTEAIGAGGNSELGYSDATRIFTSEFGSEKAKGDTGRVIG